MNIIKSVLNLFDFVLHFRNGSLDIFIGDKPILDYYSGTDHDCKLQPYGDPLYDDVYAVGMTKNFVLKVCSSVIVIITIIIYNRDSQPRGIAPPKGA